MIKVICSTLVEGTTPNIGYEEVLIVPVWPTMFKVKTLIRKGFLEHLNEQSSADSRVSQCTCAT